MADPDEEVKSSAHIFNAQFCILGLKSSLF